MMNPRKPDRFALLEKAKRQDEIHYLNAFSCEMQHATACFGDSFSLLLWFSCHEAAEIRTVYMCACVQFTLETQNLSKGPTTSVQGQRALPFNNTCSSSESLDEDDYTLHSHDSLLSCLMSRNCLFPLSFSHEYLKKINRFI